MSYFVPPPTDRQTIRDWDAAAIDEYGVPGVVLMENAGEGCVREIESLHERAEIEPPFRIICGPGNNGGDGFVIARHLHNRGLDARVHLTMPSSKTRVESDAGINLRILERMGVPVSEPAPSGELLADAVANATRRGTIVDCLFGTGLTRAVRSPQLEWIEAMNRSALPVLAVDIPSGLDADTGLVLGVAVRARYTFTFVAPKIGFNRGDGPQVTGKVLVIGISIPRRLLARSAPPPPT